MILNKKIILSSDCESIQLSKTCNTVSGIVRKDFAQAVGACDLGILPILVCPYMPLVFVSSGNKPC